MVFILLTQNWGDIMPKVVTVCTLLAIVIMSHKNIRGSVLIGILGGMGMYYLLGLTVDGFYASLQITFVSPFKAFGKFASLSLFQVLKSGFGFSAYTALHGSTNLVLTLTVMPFTYNISYGIAFGLISYIVISIFCGDSRKIKDSSWVVALLFVAMLLLTH